jgi:hypothetical protein
MDTLYTLCRSADNRQAVPLSRDARAEVIVHKRTFFADEAAANPLVAEILRGGIVSLHTPLAGRRAGFLRGPASFFRTHELLRQTRTTNAPLLIGGREYPRAEVLGLFQRCVPNTNLHFRPWFSTVRYTTSLGLAAAGTILIAHVVALTSDDDGLFDREVAWQVGVLLFAAAILSSARRSNRDPRHAAPWNSALYLDANAALIRSGSPSLAVARKEWIPQQRLFKEPAFYDRVLAEIESGRFAEHLEVAARQAVNVQPTAA